MSRVAMLLARRPPSAEKRREEKRKEERREREKKQFDARDSIKGDDKSSDKAI